MFNKRVEVFTASPFKFNCFYGLKFQSLTPFACFQYFHFQDFHVVSTRSLSPLCSRTHQTQPVTTSNASLIPSTFYQPLGHPQSKRKQANLPCRPPTNDPLPHGQSSSWAGSQDSKQVHNEQTGTPRHPRHQPARPPACKSLVFLEHTKNLFVYKRFNKFDSYRKCDISYRSVLSL